MADILDQRWHSYSGDDLARAVVSVGESLYDDQQNRINRARELTGLFEGHRFAEWSESAYYTSEALGEATLGYSTMRWNLSRSVALTVQAEIAGLNRPKVQYVTNGAEWEIKRRAKRLDRFVEGQFYLPQSGYESAWELGAACFLDAINWGMGVAKVTADVDDERICIERVFQHELFCDMAESAKGCPQNLFHIYPADLDSLVAQYPEKAEELKRAQAPKEASGSRGLGGGRSMDERVVKTVMVYEAWRLPINGKIPGKWCRAVSGGVLLEESEWDRPEFPFAFIRWTAHQIGFFGTALIEETEQVNHWVNYELERIYEAEKLTPKGVCLYPVGAVQTENLLSNEDAINIPFTGTVPPVWHSPASFDQSSLELLQMNWAKGFELAGVSQMNATARREAGLSSGVALRTVANIQTKRFSVAEHDYENFYVTLSRLIVAAAEDLAAENPDFSVGWPNGDFLKEIKFSEASLADQTYIIQTYPVSGTKNTPADRLQLAQELLSQGQMSGDAYVRVVQYMDTQAELERNEKQTAVIDRYIEDWLDAKPEDIATGKFEFRSPDKFLPRPEEALIQVMDAYMENDLDGCPDANLDLFRRFLTGLDQIIQERAARAAGLQQPPAGAAAPPQPQAVN